MIRIAIVAYAALLLCGAQSNSAISARIADLKHQAQKAHPKDDALIYAKLAHELALAGRNYVDMADTQSAQAALSDALHYASLATDSALTHHHKMKDTEIELRECENTLNETSHAVAAADAPTLKQAADQIDAMRNKILTAMFSKD